jgi:hypothetical protein
MEPEILKATPYRRMFKFALLCFVAVAAACIVGAKRYIVSWLLSTNDPGEMLARLRGFVTLAVSLPMLLLSTYLARLAWRIFRSKQYPPPKTIVWRDTPIVRGAGARWRAWVLTVLALFALGGAIYSQTIPARLAGKSRPTSAPVGLPIDSPDTIAARSGDDSDRDARD